MTAALGQQGDDSRCHISPRGVIRIAIDRLATSGVVDVAGSLDPHSDLPAPVFFLGPVSDQVAFGDEHRLDDAS